jgi:hypothetical protein
MSLKLTELKKSSNDCLKQTFLEPVRVLELKPAQNKKSLLRGQQLRRNKKYRGPML